MKVLNNLFMDLGLVPKVHLYPGRPDRGVKPPTRVLRPARKVKDTRTQVSWGTSKTEMVVESTPLDGSAVLEYTVEKKPVTAALPSRLPWTVYDVQAFQYEQARTKSFTLRQYRGLREAYLKDRAMTNAAAGKVYGKGESWGAKRLRAVRKAVDQIQEDLDNGKPLPYPE